MSLPLDAIEIPESPDARRGRSCSTASMSSQKSKQGGTKAQRKSSSLPGDAVEYLKAWMMSPEHVAHPYPTEQEKALIMDDTGIELKQLTNWFVNNRKRYWKPRVEARLQHQAVTVATSVSTANLVSPNSSREICPQSLPPLQKPPAFSLNLEISQAFEPKTAPPAEPVTTTHDVVPSALVEGATEHILTTTQPRAVSVASNSGSESGNVSDSNSAAGDSTFTADIDQISDIVVRTEAVDVHILRPICVLGKADDKPHSIEDVTILPNVPTTRILRSYRNVTLMFHYPKEIEDDRKKIQGRRDSEVVRIKKQYLKQYLSDCTAADLLAMRVMPTKRKRVDEFVEDVVLRRRKFSEPSPSLFREVCIKANHVYDMGLPSLEEATALFGYAQ